MNENQQLTTLSDAYAAGSRGEPITITLGYLGGPQTTFEADPNTGEIVVYSTNVDPRDEAVFNVAEFGLIAALLVTVAEGQ